MFTDTAEQPSTELAPHQPATPATKPERVTGKVRKAVEAMVWSGLPRKDAAQAAGLSEHGLYKALRRPPVKAFYLAELEVLRTSARARNFHVLEEVRDQTTNQMARVNAIKAMEQLPDDASSRAQQQSPGLVIHIHGDARVTGTSSTSSPPSTLNPLIEHDDSESER